MNTFKLKNETKPKLKKSKSRKENEDNVLFKISFKLFSLGFSFSLEKSSAPKANLSFQKSKEEL